MLTSTDKGNLAELKIATEAVGMGISVSRPLCEGRRYDLVFDVGDRLLRIQCKWGQLKGDVVAAHIGTCRFTPNGYRTTAYKPSEVDAIAVYCRELDRTYLLPIDELNGQSVVHCDWRPVGTNNSRALEWLPNTDSGL